MLMHLHLVTSIGYCIVYICIYVSSFSSDCLPRERVAVFIHVQKLTDASEVPLVFRGCQKNALPWSHHRCFLDVVAGYQFLH